MIRLPHDLILAPRIARLWGHDGWTLMFWTFVSTMPVGARFARHERRHITHWCAGTALGAVVIGALCWFTSVSWWFLLAAPVGFLGPYFASFVPGLFETPPKDVSRWRHAYDRSWFERDAERYADA